MPYIVVAIHERTEKVAGLTELVVPAQHPTRADQYDTVIVPEHNGYGLARAIKARMLLELRTAEPQLREVQTWHATDREQLQQVNKELGFQPDREWREYEVDAADLRPPGSATDSPVISDLQQTCPTCALRSHRSPVASRSVAGVSAAGGRLRRPSR